MHRATAEQPPSDLSHLARWLKDVPGVGPEPYSLQPVAGGRTNLTYRVTCGDDSQVAIRRAPTASATSAAAGLSAREKRAMTAAREAGLPVPSVLGACMDAQVLGTPFTVMEWIDGIALDTDSAAAELDESARARVGGELARLLACAHSLDISKMGLDDWRRPGTYLHRELARWGPRATTALERIIDHACSCVNTLAAIAKEIAHHHHTEPHTRLVHGDYRLANVLVDQQGRVQAVLDWELATVGDPLADLAYLLVMWEPYPSLGTPTATTLPGFATPHDILEVYGNASSLLRGTADLSLHLAFAAWRSACIGAVVWARYEAGEGAGTPIERDAAHGYVEHYLKRCQEYLG